MRKRVIPAIVLIAYIAFLSKVMVFKDVPTIHIGQLMLNFAGTDGGHPANFVPFTTIVPYLLGHNGLIIAGINLLGNIVLLVPVGFLLPFIWPRISWRKTLVIAVASGLLIEVMQTVLRVGIFDIDDVILNAFGVMLGYFAILILYRWARERKYAYILGALLLSIAAIAAAFYFVYPWGQPVVGSEVRDLCGGTGGTGEITNVGNTAITIKSKAGVVQTINLTSRTDIRNSEGPIAESDLKIGDHVTVVVMDESKTASTVLVCREE